MAVLTTFRHAPHAIPVSAMLRADDSCIAFAMVRTRGALECLRTHAQVALTVVTEGDNAFTARGHARVVQEQIADARGYAAVALNVEHIDFHRQPAYRVESAVDRRWIDKANQREFDEVVGALRKIAANAS